MERERLVEGMLAHESKLHRFALKLTKNSQDADDLLQQTFLKCIEAAESVRNAERLFPWMKKVLRNEFLRGKRRTPASPLVHDQPDELMTEPLDCENDRLLAGVISVMSSKHGKVLSDLMTVDCDRKRTAEINGISDRYVDRILQIARTRVSNSDQAPASPDREQRISRALIEIRTAFRLLDSIEQDSCGRQSAAFYRERIEDQFEAIGKFQQASDGALGRHITGASCETTWLFWASRFHGSRVWSDRSEGSKLMGSLIRCLLVYSDLIGNADEQLRTGTDAFIRSVLPSADPLRFNAIMELLRRAAFLMLPYVYWDAGMLDFLRTLRKYSKTSNQGLDASIHDLTHWLQSDCHREVKAFADEGNLHTQITKCSGVLRLQFARGDKSGNLLEDQVIQCPVTIEHPWPHWIKRLIPN